jgi:hypothetical protein
VNNTSSAFDARAAIRRQVCPLVFASEAAGAPPPTNPTVLIASKQIAANKTTGIKRRFGIVAPRRYAA